MKNHSFSPCSVLRISGCCVTQSMSTAATCNMQLIPHPAQLSNTLSCSLHDELHVIHAAALKNLFPFSTTSWPTWFLTQNSENQKRSDWYKTNKKKQTNQTAGSLIPACVLWLHVEGFLWEILNRKLLLLAVSPACIEKAEQRNIMKGFEQMIGTLLYSLWYHSIEACVKKLIRNKTIICSPLLFHGYDHNQHKLL